MCEEHFDCVSFPYAYIGEKRLDCRRYCFDSRTKVRNKVFLRRVCLFQLSSRFMRMYVRETSWLRFFCSLPPCVGETRTSTASVCFIVPTFVGGAS